MNREILQKNGIFYDEGLERFSGNEGLYKKYLNRFTESPLYEEMKAAIEENNIPEAFSCAHKLKGFLGNLSINGFYDDVCSLTEVLRFGQKPEENTMRRMDEQYITIINAIKGDV